MALLLALVNADFGLRHGVPSMCCGRSVARSVVKSIPVVPLVDELEYVKLNGMPLVMVLIKVTCQPPNASCMYLCAS